MIDEPPEVDAPDAQPLAADSRRGRLRRRQLRLRRRRAGAASMSTCTPQPGQIVALVGPTGAGKTTIVNLLTRFYEIDSGQHHDRRPGHPPIKKDDLRRQLGIVLQDTFLFAGTVMDNIRYGRLDATDDEVIAAARLANADQFIHRLPQGYDTPLSERGSNLSQGQRQLLAIARAMLADPAHPDPGRGDQQRRHAHRAAHPGGDAAADGGPHQLRDRPPARAPSATPTRSW